MNPENEKLNLFKGFLCFLWFLDIGIIISIPCYELNYIKILFSTNLRYIITMTTDINSIENISQV